MANTNLPTGNEPPKGYEPLIEALGRERSDLRVDRVSATQLSSLEIRELELIRKRAIERVREAIGDRGFEITFDREMNLWPEDRSPSDKLLFRAYGAEDGLLGYALVVRIWPTEREWTIQHLIIDPDKRLHGVGAAIVRAIEDDALATTHSVDAIESVPLVDEGNGFWDFMGYSAAGNRSIRLEGGRVFDHAVYRKVIR